MLPHMLPMLLPHSSLQAPSDVDVEEMCVYGLFFLPAINLARLAHVVCNKRFYCSTPRRKAFCLSFSSQFRHWSREVLAQSVKHLLSPAMLVSCQSHLLLILPNLRFRVLEWKPYYSSFLCCQCKVNILNDAFLLYSYENRARVLPLAPVTHLKKVPQEFLGFQLLIILSFFCQGCVPNCVCFCACEKSWLSGHNWPAFCRKKWILNALKEWQDFDARNNHISTNLHVLELSISCHFCFVQKVLKQCGCHTSSATQQLSQPSCIKSECNC